jgi:ABC-type ATPase involved in cell division
VSKAVKAITCVSRADTLICLVASTPSTPGMRTSITATWGDRRWASDMNYALIDNESVDYNRLVAQEYVAGKGKDKRRARAEVLERVGLAKVARNKVFELSGGEQQRVAVARLLLKPCELVLADEPTGPLDGANRDAVLAQLIEMNEAGKTVVIVTHDPKVAAACPRQVSLPAARVNARKLPAQRRRSAAWVAPTAVATSRG